MKNNLLPAAALIVLSLFASVTLASNSPQAGGAVTFLNGGIGKDEADAMRREAKAYPLHLTFSERRDGEFIVNVPVVITDARGRRVLDLPKAGPLLYVRLPNGKYKVSARFNNVTESQNVTLAGKEGKDLYFHWKGASN